MKKLILMEICLCVSGIANGTKSGRFTLPGAGLTIRWMTRLSGISWLVVWLFVPSPTQMRSQPASTESRPDPQSVTARDGQHDFDFSFGTWKTHISRRLHPLTGSTTWVEFAGTSVVSKIWNGQASLGETEADGPTGHLEALSLRLYNPESHQWSLTYASSGGTTSTPTALSVPAVGEFKNGRGEFYDTELFNGRSVLVRNVWSDISASSIRFEQAFSEDGGRTWEVNWIATDTKAEADNVTPNGIQRGSSKDQSGESDFAFEIGNWKTHLSRLLRPLTGSRNWVEYEGLTVVRPIWGGRANLVELEADGPAGNFQGLNLRLYNPQSHQWSLNFASSRDGRLSQPTIGEFRNGRGEFYDQETLNGRAIFVRLIISNITPRSCRFEQAFSEDGGKTWEVNWIATDTRVKPDQRTRAVHSFRIASLSSSALGFDSKAAMNGRRSISPMYTRSKKAKLRKCVRLPTDGMPFTGLASSNNKQGCEAW